MIISQLKPISKKEGGYASFVITLITIIVVSLIVVAFSSDSRLEQKDSLANNLSTQAYYAAESGINDAYAVIQSDYTNKVSPIPSTGNLCAKAGTPYVNSGKSNVLSGNISYDCLIVNTTPNSVGYQDLEPGGGWVVPINTANPITDLTIGWDNGGGSDFSACSGTKNNPGATLHVIGSYAGCDAGVLQVDMISGADLSSELGASNPFISKATTFFMEPSAASITPALTQDAVYYVQCSASASPHCSVQIPLGGVSDSYYLHIQSFYEDSDVQIEADGAGGTPQPITDSQVLIDSTGNADGQLKRLVARVCSNAYCGTKSSSTVSPNAALQSTECINKNFTVYPGEPANNPAAAGHC